LKEAAAKWKQYSESRKRQQAEGRQQGGAVKEEQKKKELKPDSANRECGGRAIAAARRASPRTDHSSAQTLE
jgi:hypothetical protein